MESKINFFTKLYQSKLYNFVSFISTVHWLIYSVISIIVFLVGFVMNRPFITLMEWFALTICIIPVFILAIRDFKRLGKYKRWVVFSPLVALIIVLTIWWRYSTYEPFEPIYSMYSTKLGHKESRPQKQKHAVMLVHKYATVIWLGNSNSFYLIPNGSSSKQEYQFLQDTKQEPDKRYFNLELRQKDFPQCVSPYKPPYGGVARIWSRNRTKIDWIGCEESAYLYGHYSIVMQKFKKGEILGVFSNECNEKSLGTKKSGTIYVFFDDLSWKTEEIYSTTIPCSQLDK